MSPTIVIDIGSTAPAPRPWIARKAMRLGMFQAAAASTDPSRNAPMPNSMMGLRPMVSASFAYKGTVTADASMYTENSHGNSGKPPMPATIDCTAVAMTVESMATSPVESIMASRSGPRSDRRPIPALSTLATGSPDLVRHGLQAVTVPGYSRRVLVTVRLGPRAYSCRTSRREQTYGWAGAAHGARRPGRVGSQRVYERVGGPGADSVRRIRDRDAGRRRQPRRAVGHGVPP